MLPIVSYHERADRLAPILDRRAAFDEDVETAVVEIIRNVREGGDDAVQRLTKQYDGVTPRSIRVPNEVVSGARSAADSELMSVIEEAALNIRKYHEHQRQNSWFVEAAGGVLLGQRVLPIERVGLYVPGGKAFYPSSLLMNAIPAQVAGVPEIHLVSPPTREGVPHPLVLATADMLGLRHVYAVGGAQAVAALAYGTDSIPAVDKIVGPGNVFVQTAKRRVFGHVDIDSIAGPTEIVVLADSSANPEFVAADLLSQAEHDERASAILVTPYDELARSVAQHINEMVPRLSRSDVIEASLAAFGACIVTESMEEAIDMVNELAPEHLELMVSDPWAMLPQIRHAGAVFLGSYSSEPVGDYFAGTNHVLPTGGTARYASPLGVDDFVRKQSIISYTHSQLLVDGPKIVRFAEAEHLTAHARAIQIRLDRDPS